MCEIKPPHPHAFESASLQINAIVPVPIAHLQARAKHTFCQKGKIEGSLLGKKKQSNRKQEMHGRKKPWCLSLDGRQADRRDTHPHDHHLDGDVLRKADRSPEVHGQGHEQVQDGHQVLPMNCFSRGREEGSCLRSGYIGTLSPHPQGNETASKRDLGGKPQATGK